jgi:T5SS/PEP-CTERM-associated repeat protein
MIVSGAQSFGDFTNTVEVGFGGTGLLTVSGGAVLDAGEGLDSLNIGDVYNGAIGSGTVTIDASTAYLAGVIEVGAYGQGSLDLSNGATVDAYFYLPGTPPAWSALIGAAAGSTGTLSISSRSTMLASEGIAVGSSGSGVLDVSNATLSIAAHAASGVVALDAGVGNGSAGVVDVAGGTIQDEGAAGIVIGGVGTGRLVITALSGQGGRVLTGSAAGVALTVGASAGSAGSVSISGAGSGLGAAGEVADGAGGSGSIALSGQAQLVAGVSGTTAALVIGGNGGSGVLSLAGASLASATGQILVGEFGPGRLSVTGGSGLVGTASGQAALVVGVSSGSTGSVLVSDPYSFAALTGGITVGSLGNGSMTVQNQASVTVRGTTSPTTPALLIGAGTGSSGTVTLASQAALTALGAGIVVAADGAGVLSVNSATLTVTASPGVGVSALNIGVSAGASGTVSLTGGLITDTQAAGVIVGDSGEGLLAISSAGTQGGLVLTGDPTGTSGLAVGVAAGSSGTVTIDGSASGLAVYGTADVGSSGQGTITASDGGHFVADLGASSTGLVLGGSGGEGTFLLEGAAQGYVVGQTIIGQLGDGAMAVTEDSSFTGTASGVPAMVIGASTTGTGSLLVTDLGSYVPLVGGLVVGSDGNGIVEVENSAVLAVFGSTAQNLPGMIIGQNGGSTGDLAILSGAQVQTGTGIAVGLFGHGEIDVVTATLTVATSPSLEVPALDAGVSAGSSGVVNIEGGLLQDTQAAGIIIGDIGTGTLSIAQLGSHGGTLLTGNLTSSTGFLVGNAASATGSVSVSGSVSGLGVYGATVVGASGVGSITVLNAASFVSGEAANGIGLVLGGNVGGIGSLALSGAAQSAVLGQTDVGQLGSGFLTIDGGSGMTDTTVGAPAMVVAGGSGSTGTVLVTDQGSYLSLSGGLEVGGAGYGTLTVAGQATVASSGTLSVGSHGDVVASGSGSSLSAAAVSNLGTIVASGGALSFLGAVSGSGSLAIDTNGSISLGSTGTNALVFGANGGRVLALNAADIAGTVSGWSAGDFIDLANTAASSESFANGTLSLFGSQSQLVGTIKFGAGVSAENFTLTASGSGGTAIGYHS